METTQRNLKLCVERTFLHVKDVNVEASKMSASKSDPRSDACQDLGSSSDVQSDFSNHDCRSGTSDASSRFGSQRPKGGWSKMETAHKNFQLCVQRTFIDEVDLDVEACKVRASKSEPGSDACKELDLSQPLSDFSTSDWCSITSAEGSSSFSSKSSGSQRPRLLRLPDKEQLGGLLRDQPPTGSMTDDKVGPVDPSWTIGSELHASGQCKPCAWLFKAKGCSLGSKCNFCHLCPNGKIKEKRKEKDAQLRQQRLDRERKALAPGRVECAVQPSKRIVFL